MNIHPQHPNHKPLIDNPATDLQPETPPLDNQPLDQAALLREGDEEAGWEPSGGADDECPPPMTPEEEQDDDRPRISDNHPEACRHTSAVHHPVNSLLPAHLHQLSENSGIDPQVIQERGYRSIVPESGYSLLKQHGFSRSQAKNVPGILLPLHTTDGRQPMMVYRPDAPRHGKDGKALKYEIPKGARVRLDCPPRCHAQLADPSMPLWITEGQKKADALASHGLCAIDLLGVWNFKGKNTFGGTTLLADFDYLALKGRQVRIVFDNDWMTKGPVRQALDRLTEHLQRKGAQVSVVYLPQEGGQKLAVDDYLLTHSVQDLAGLVEGPRPQPQAAKPIITLLVLQRGFTPVG